MQSFYYFCKVQKYSLFLKRTIAIFLFLLCTLNARTADNLGLCRVVIDAGHGGHDPGCVSKDRKTYEKTLTLDIATMLSQKISAAYPDVEVVMTRPGDSFVSLDYRAEKANKSDANLFISLHVNASTSASPSGYSVHVMGQSSNSSRDLYAYNMDVCRRENSVIKLEDDYSTKYQGFDPSDPESFIFMQLMQNAYLEQSLVFAQMVSDNLSGGPISKGRGIWQDPFYVLWKTAMPAVLVELGFISNSADLDVLRNSKCREELAERLFNAFAQYKRQYDRSVQVEAPSGQAVNTGESRSASAPEAAPESKVLYGIQIFVSSKLREDSDPAFLGSSVKKIKSGDLYKYVICLSDSPEAARSHLQDVRKSYPDCFLVSVEGDIVRIVR